MVNLASDLPGISYRQLDYWCRQGYLKAATGGTGQRRTWSSAELSIAQRMALLVRAGMVAESAAQVARDTITAGIDTVTLLPGLHLTFGAAPSTSSREQTDA